jgi:hypothetical protein
MKIWYARRRSGSCVDELLDAGKSIMTPILICVADGAERKSSARPTGRGPATPLHDAPRRTRR